MLTESLGSSSPQCSDGFPRARSIERALSVSRKLQDAEECAQHRERTLGAEQLRADAVPREPESYFGIRVGHPEKTAGARMTERARARTERRRVALSRAAELPRAAVPRAQRPPEPPKCDVCGGPMPVAYPLLPECAPVPTEGCAKCAMVGESEA